MRLEADQRKWYCIVCAESRLWVWTSQEILIAKYFWKPVITILPKDTQHRRTNLLFHGKMIQDRIHPFIWSCSDVIYTSIDMCLLHWDEVHNISPKTIDVIDESIEYASSLS